MRASKILFQSLIGLWLIACDGPPGADVSGGAGGAGGGAGGGPGVGGGAPAAGAYTAGLQTGGAIGLPVSDSRRERIEISAPITPRTDVIYPAQGAAYPSAPADEQALGLKAALTFRWLLLQCADYKGLVVPATDDEVLPVAQRIVNYNLIAACAYTKFSGKPYWIPQLVNDVDLCWLTLGKDWRLLREQDLADLRDDEYAFLGDTLAGVDTGGGLGGYYFTLLSYVRGSDGALKLGDLSRGARTRVSPLDPATIDYKSHLEHQPPVTLRCLRRTAP